MAVMKMKLLMILMMMISTAPDFDLNMEWMLEEEVMSHVDILTLDAAASGQYRLKVVPF